MILISSHQDRVRNDIPTRVENGKIYGLLDNSIGNMVSIMSLVSSSLQVLHRDGDIKFFFNQHEEFGLIEGFPELNPEKDIVICIDVCAGDRYKGKDIGIEQFYGQVDKIAEAIGGLCWEGYQLYIKKYTGDPKEADECDQWVKLGIPCLSFIIPIECKNNNWHGEASITVEKLQKAILILQRLICYLV